MRRPVVFAALLLAACGQIPQPFRHTAPNPLLDPLPLAGVTVSPAIDSPEPSALAETMAEALVAQEVAALVGPARPGGMTVEAVVTDDHGAVLVSWQLRGGDGVLLRQHAEQVSLKAWSTPEGRAATAKTAAPVLAAALHGGPQPAWATQPTVAVPLVTGAPGDGATALKAAMASAMRRAGYVVGDAPGAAFVVAGAVLVSPGPAGQDRLDITWTVRTPDGHDLGSVAQGNPVPHGSLETAWGSLARIIADAAADGVIDVIRSGSDGVPR